IWASSGPSPSTTLVRVSASGQSRHCWIEAWTPSRGWAKTAVMRDLLDELEAGELRGKAGLGEVTQVLAAARRLGGAQRILELFPGAVGRVLPRQGRDPHVTEVRCEL